jgi:hypothetical protein
VPGSAPFSPGGRARIRQAYCVRATGQLRCRQILRPIRRRA